MRKLQKSIYFISFPLSFIGFIFPIYAASLGANVIEIGYLYSIFSIIGLIIRPIVGNLIDKRGRKLGVLIGVILYTLVNLIFIMSKDMKYLLIARILQSLGASFLWISVDTFISDVSDKTNRGKNFGSMSQTMAKGQWIGSMIAFTILFNVSNDPFKTIFTIFLCTSLIALYYTIKEVPETISHKKDFKEGIINDRKDLGWFLIVIGIISLLTSLTTPIYLIYLQEHITDNLILISYLFVPASILSMYLPRKFGELCDKYGREKIFIIGLLLIALLQILIPFAKGYYIFMMLYTLISVVDMFFGPAYSSLIIDFVGEDKRGKSYGLYSFAGGIGGAIGPLIGSYIYEKIGNNIVFYLKGILMIVMVVFICYIYIKKFKQNELAKITKISQ